MGAAAGCPGFRGVGCVFEGVAPVFVAVAVDCPLLGVLAALGAGELRLLPCSIRDADAADARLPGAGARIVLRCVYKRL